MAKLLSIPTALASLALVTALLSCRKEAESEPAISSQLPEADAELQELVNFRNSTRQLYNNRKFAELEALATTIRAGKERIGNGSWKIFQFYDSMECREDEPESMWRLHDTIHREWEAKFPQSITACVARAEFLTTYAWHARTDQFAADVTDEGWRLFGERLAESRTLLEQSKSLAPACPMWWETMQTVALGQGWSRADYDALFEEAKRLEPQFFAYDLSRARYLLPRWHGEPGEWEAAAAKEIARSGHQIYARVVGEQAGYYDNIFKRSAASWRKTRVGFDELLIAHPDSNHLLNRYCRLACLAGDRDAAKSLFIRIGEMKANGIWKKNEFQRGKAWAMKP
jgi:hypothetical protein